MPLITHLLIGTLCFLASAGAASESQLVDAGGVAFAIPKGSPVRFSSRGEYPGQANFEGRFVLRGTYHYGYLTDDAAYNQLELYFVPEKKLSRLLPYWNQRGKVKEIRFSNDRAFVDAVVPNSALAALKAKKRFSVSGKAAVWVSDYKATIDCDYPTYSVLFQSIYRPPSVVLSKARVDQYGC